MIEMAPVEKKQLAYLITSALEEDCPNGDITSELFLTHGQSNAQLVAKEAGVFFGEDILHYLCDAYHITLVLFKQDGDWVDAKTVVCHLSGDRLMMLKIERVLLNFLQRLSGIATQTRAYVRALNNPNIALMDTRKTTPLLRFLERRAVVAGGGVNHRNSLSDMILLKENHLAQLAKKGQLIELTKLIAAAKQQYPTIKVELEIEHTDQLIYFDYDLVDVVMFDNFCLDDVKKGVEICQKRRILSQIEVSGNVGLDTIASYSNVPIHRISVGSLTHSVKALDLSLLLA